MIAIEDIYEKSMPIPESGCLIWMGALSTTGYGVIYRKRKQILVHRFSYILKNGEIKDNLFVCHRCDTPSCVNPNHLFLGTPKDNMQDCVKKGRHPEAKKTHCQGLHPLSGENLYLRFDGKRACRICMKESKRRSNEKRRALGKVNVS